VLDSVLSHTGTTLVSSMLSWCSESRNVGLVFYTGLYQFKSTVLKFDLMLVAGVA